MDTTSYLIVVSASLGIAYFLYRLFFMNQRKFNQQRFFLIGSIAISVLLPLSQISIEVAGKEAANTGSILPFYMIQSPADQPKIAESGLIQNIVDYVPYIYIIVSAGFILMLVIQIFRILQLYGSSRKVTSGKLVLVKSEKVKSPFSFFSWVFLPVNFDESEESESIIIHEEVHASHYHSIDNLLLEVLTAFLWFNPFVWMMKKSLHLVHEYLADEGTLKSGVEKTRYQAILVNHVAEEKLLHISSSFNNNLKKRIIMMTKSKNKNHNRSGILALIPLSVIMFVIVAVLNGLFISNVNASDGNQEKKQKETKNKDKEIVVVGYGAKKDQASQGTENMNYIVDGVSMKNIDNLSPDSIESVNVLKTDRTIVIRTKGFAKKNPESQMQIKTGTDKVLYILDGNNISEEQLRGIEPSTIERLEVIKEKERIQKYTDKDYDGVVLVTSKK